jgi:hypothetical protein
MAAKVRMNTEKMGAFYIFKQHGSDEGNKGTQASAAVGVAEGEVAGICNSSQRHKAPSSLTSPVYVLFPLSSLDPSLQTAEPRNQPEQVSA